MKSDPVVTEIRKIREEQAARFSFDVTAIGRDAQKRDSLGDRPVVRRPPRPAAKSVLADSPKVQAILGKSRRQIKENGGIPHDTFWKGMADDAGDDDGGILASLAEYRGRPLSREQIALLRRLKKNDYAFRPTGTAKKTIRIYDLRGRNRGYINASVFSNNGIFGYRFEDSEHFKGADHFCLDEAPNRLDEFRKKYGKRGWIHHDHARDPNKQHIVVTDIQFAYKILGVDE